MRKFFDKAKSSMADGRSQFPSSHSQQQPMKEHDTPSTIGPPSTLDILRYRYHHGTNLGSVFVLEQWLSGSMFEAGAKGGSELDAVNASLAKCGVEATRAKWEAHWSNALSDSDLDFLCNTAHCTTIRLPIGYFTLGPSFTEGTPFAGAPSQVYLSAWSHVLSLTSRLAAHGIGTLLDLHALPGGANTDCHSGTSKGKAELWAHRSQMDLGKRCLLFMAEAVAQGKVEGCIGVQVCNEAAYGARGMYDWYTDVIRTLSRIDSSLPIYVSDAWDLSTAVTWAQARNGITSDTNPVVVDTHKYYTFTDADKAQSPQQIIRRVSGELEEMTSKAGNVVDRGAVGAVVGEWSCVLDGQTWQKAAGGDRESLVREFGQAQSRRWRQGCGGSFFWTAKMEWMDGGEWGFWEMTKKGAVVPPRELLLAADDVKGRIASAQQQREQKKNETVGTHVGYWNQTSPGGQFEHWRFEQGWDVGFSDALAFFGLRTSGGLGGSSTGGDTIGHLDLWVRKRIMESGQGGRFLWEFEQGFRHGVDDFYKAVGL
ncbi:MAG: glycoside hydrolase family 5 [Lasallia pustulata]|uniref:Glycoside hydrolase family 5 n=1 Tax=Lasallia pustulata TaxID=136370 RepID=A0A5M8PFB3_9LECA|nr:MAG: glycoside hydrolase family 5 [Lasallia pustulata]